MHTKGSKHLDLQYRTLIEQGLNNHCIKLAIGTYDCQNIASCCFLHLIQCNPLFALQIPPFKHFNQHKK